ncbi:MAG: hypothetical protein AAF065_14590 [Verrucomicrobiota bacterium]
MSIEIKDIAELSSALLTPVIGVVTTIILVNQYRLEKRKWKLDLFDKRYAVYRATLEFIAAMMRHGKCTPESQGQFLQGTRDRGLFFEKEVDEILDEVWHLGVDLEMHQDIFKDLPVGEERSKHVRAAGELKKSLPSLGKKVQDRFADYIQLKEK